MSVPLALTHVPITATTEETVEDITALVLPATHWTLMATAQVIIVVERSSDK